MGTNGMEFASAEPRRRRPSGEWPTPRQLTAWLGLLGVIGAGMLWAGSLLYAPRSEFIEVKTDVKYIRASIDDLKNQLSK